MNGLKKIVTRVWMVRDASDFRNRTFAQMTVRIPDRMTIRSLL